MVIWVEPVVHHLRVRSAKIVGAPVPGGLAPAFAWKEEVGLVFGHVQWKSRHGYQNFALRPMLAGWANCKRAVSHSWRPFWEADGMLPGALVQALVEQLVCSKTSW